MKINIDEIKIINRKRNAGDVSQLCVSINEIGLLQPVTVTSDFKLIAGLHRITACKLLGWKDIEVNVVDYDSNLLSELAEIDENLIRNELTVLDKSIQTNRRKEIYEILHPHTAQGKTTNRANQHTIKNEESGIPCHLPLTKTESFVEQTAKATNQSERKIRKDARIGKILKPLEHLITGTKFEDNLKELDELVKIADDKKGDGIEVAKQVSLIAIENKKYKISDAYKHYKKNIEQQKIQALREDSKNTFTEPLKVKQGEWFELGKHKIYCGSNLDDNFINNLPNCSFAFADPPYNANVDEWDSGFKWNQDYLQNYAKVVAVTPGGWQANKLYQDSKMNYIWELACWIKNGMTHGKCGYSNWIKIAIFAKEQNKPKISQDFKDITIKTSETTETSHKGRKPYPLMEWLIDMFTEVEDIVIDPFLGSGTTLLQCEKMGRVCYAAEMNIDYCNDIVERFNNLKNKAND
jgi:ParB family chromosome partitioning protein